MPTRRDYYDNLYREKPKRGGSFLRVLVAVLVVLLVAVAGLFAYKILLPGSDAAQTQPVGQDATAFTQDLPSDVIATADNVTMTIAGSKDTYVLVGEDYIESGCHAVEYDTADLTDTIVTTGEVDTSKPGTYEVTYTATATNGAKAEAVRNVHVVESFESNAKSVPVFMYHYVYDADDPPSDIDANWISDDLLAEHCAYLKENGYYYPSYNELRAWIDGKHTLPAKSCILTFDDGAMNFIKNGIPVLEQHEVPATSFMVAENGNGLILDYPSEYIQYQSHSYALHHGGGGKGQGGLIHALSEEEVYEDIMSSNEVTGQATALAYPFGDNHEDAWRALERGGILCAFTVKNDRVRPGDNPYALNRVRINGGNSLQNFINLVQPNG